MKVAYKIDNPLGVENIGDIFKVLTGRILEIVIPIAVLLYVWAGVQMLMAAGRPAYVASAKKTFLYTTIGLVVIFIGGGFVSLIKSVLNAGAEPTPAPIEKSACTTDADCPGGYCVPSIGCMKP